MMSFLRRLSVVALLSASVLGLVALVSFWLFVQGLERDEPDDLAEGQAIVVLTGGADRLADGLKLLEAGKGERLLVSGVHPGTSLMDFKRLMPDRARLLACCTDLDHAAVNTRDNAREAARWAKSHGYSRLIIVTASYHVPRARLEFRQRLPQAVLAFYPVVPDVMGLRAWWREPHLLRILVFEYAKYRLAQLRRLAGLGPAPETGA